MKNITNLFTSKVPVLLVGPPGVGKTAIVSSTFDYAETMLASTMVEEDIAGIPYREDKYDLRTIPAMFRRLKEASDSGKSTVLFIDEIDKARRSVADTLLTLIASRRVGETSLPMNTCIVAAANPPNFGGGDGVSDAMISRFSVVDFVPSVESWCEWARKRFSLKSILRVIGRIESGEIPLIEAVGEGFEKRISSPRTITLALDFFVNTQDESSFEIIASGLLTQNVCSKIAYFLMDEKEETMDKSVSIALKSKNSDKKRKPLVI